MNKLDQTHREWLDKCELDEIKQYIEEREKPKCEFKKDDILLFADNHAPTADNYSNVGAFNGRSDSLEYPYKDGSDNYWGQAAPPHGIPNIRISWEGGECPVDGNREVIAELESGTLLKVKAGDLCWGYLTSDARIIAYTLLPEGE